MPTVTVRGVPERLHRYWKARAKRNGRTLNQEIVEVLTGARVTLPRFSAKKEAELMASVRAQREELAAKGISTTPEEIEHFIQAGRK
jgi:plasmid stability protein